MDDRFYAPFVTALTQIGLAIMRLEPPKSALDAQWLALKTLGLDGNDVLAALVRGRSEWTQFPAPADIRRMAMTIRRERNEARENARVLSVAGLKPSRYSFMLAELGDPDVPEAKKERIRAQWHREHPNARAPWEEDTCQKSA